jgi:hypothetical protein
MVGETKEIPSCHDCGGRVVCQDSDRWARPRLPRGVPMLVQHYSIVPNIAFPHIVPRAMALAGGVWTRTKRRQRRTALRRYTNSKQASKHLSWLHWRRGTPNTMPCLSNINHRHLDASRCGLADWTGYVGTSRCEVVLHDAVSGRESNQSVLALPGPHKSHLGSRISGNRSGLVPHLVPQPPKSSLPPTRQRAQLSRK